MKIVVLDITGRNAEQYNPSLCKGISDNLSSGKVILMTTNLYIKPEGYSFRKLLTLVPKKYSGSKTKGKRVLRALESIINYIYVLLYVTLFRVDILHIQWLPFLEFMSGERIFLSVVHLFNPKIKIFLTMHNVYPHLLSEEKWNCYKNRFLLIDSYIDGYIVHLFNSKNELINKYGIRQDKIFVAYHGIYKPDDLELEKGIDNRRDYKKIILFGMQDRYKGADLLIKSLLLLPSSYLNKLRVKIVGRADPVYYDECKVEAAHLNVEWENSYVPSRELYQSIGESDLILLPYRNITQSGVLLLALSYRIPILTSDLPSFKETLEGYPDDYFFKADDVVSLRDILIDYLDGKIDERLIKERIEALNYKYSWNETGKSTVEAYGNILSK
jgi:glycosyltransferase involved in cell wall biosynthesis